MDKINEERDLFYKSEAQRFYERIMKGEITKDEANNMIETLHEDTFDHLTIQHEMDELETSHINFNISVKEGDTNQNTNQTFGDINANNNSGNLKFHKLSNNTNKNKPIPQQIPLRTKIEPPSKRRCLSKPASNLTDGLKGRFFGNVDVYGNEPQKRIDLVNEKELDNIIKSIEISKDYKPTLLPTPKLNENTQLVRKYMSTSETISSQSNKKEKKLNKRFEENTNGFKTPSRNQKILKPKTQYIPKHNTLRQMNQNENLHRSKLSTNLSKQLSQDNEVEPKMESVNEVQSKKQSVDDKRFKYYLTQWQLTKYIQVFESEGYDITEHWPKLTIKDLQEDLGMAKGHAKHFINKVKDFNF